MSKCRKILFFLIPLVVLGLIMLLNTWANSDVFQIENELREICTSDRQGKVKNITDLCYKVEKARKRLRFSGFVALYFDWNMARRLKRAIQK